MGFVGRETENNEGATEENTWLGHTDLPRDLKILTQPTVIGYDDKVIGRVLKRLQQQGYVRLGGQGSEVVRVDGEEQRKSRVKDYGNPLTYVGHLVSHPNTDIRYQALTWWFSTTSKLEMKFQCPQLVQMNGRPNVQDLKDLIRFC